MRTYRMLLLSFLWLSGCGKENPLLNDFTVENLRLVLGWTYTTATMDCPNVWAKRPMNFTPAFQKVCDEKLKKNFAFMQEHQRDIIRDATFEDFKDPTLWRMYQGDKK